MDDTATADTPSLHTPAGFDNGNGNGNDNDEIDDESEDLQRALEMSLMDTEIEEGVEVVALELSPRPTGMIGGNVASMISSSVVVVSPQQYKTVPANAPVLKSAESLVSLESLPMKLSVLSTDLCGNVVNGGSTGRCTMDVESGTLQQQMFPQILTATEAQSSVVKEPFLDIDKFHSLMWDPTLTTFSDQDRWIRQGIDVRRIPQEPNTQVEAESELDSSGALGFTRSGDIVTEKGLYHDASKSILEELAKSHFPWGLVQEHGGPCGVLAAIQAELLRIVMYESSSDDDNSNNNKSNIYVNMNKLEKDEEDREDQQLQQDRGDHLRDQHRTNKRYHDRQLSPERIHRALAGAIGTVLARAALTPPATEMDEAINNVSTAGTGTNLTNTYCSSSSSTNTQSKDDCVQIVLPNHPIYDESLTWDDLEPWPSNINNPNAGVSVQRNNFPNNSIIRNKLSLYKIQAAAQRNAPPTIKTTIKKQLQQDQHHISEESFNTVALRAQVTENDPTTVNNSNTNNLSLTSTAAKRQKTATPPLLQQQQEQQTQNDCSCLHNHCDHGATTLRYQQDSYCEGDSSDLATRILNLTKKVQQFLLEPIMIKKQESSCTPSSQQQYYRPLDHFRNNGGVLLLVLSVAITRGIPIVQSEFDDPIGSKLTSNFGHCSQELINLLLTGQAVSNVFDSTLKPPGLGMICRGVQSRPNIGYLSQLEAMRYCEVGTYYKSPTEPIWVVGSTSHFTILFGDRSALKESQSDVLLEQCRRAFKGIEGGEENGFISTNQLGSVLRKLEIAVDIDDAKIQTLAAALEVAGAGIILWDDFWKATSRLLTGASFESVVLRANSNGGLSSLYDDNENETIQGATSTASTAESYLDKKQRATSPVLPLMLTNGPDQYPRQQQQPPLLETDEEMARRLAREWEQESSTTTATTITTATTSAASTSVASAVGMSVMTEAVARAGSPMEVEPIHSTFHSNSNSNNVNNSSNIGMFMSDEELARKLQAEWDSEIASDGNGLGGVEGEGGGDNSSLTALYGSPLQHPMMFDSDNVEDGVVFVGNTASSSSSSSNNNNGVTHFAAPSTPPRTIGGHYTNTNMTTVVEEDGVGDDIDIDDRNDGTSKPPASRSSFSNKYYAITDHDDYIVNETSMNTSNKNSQHQSIEKTNEAKPLEFEQYGDTFTLYHYNGLRGGELTPLRITRLTAEEAVGSSIALNRTATGGGGGGGGGGAANGLPSSSSLSSSEIVNIAQDLEDIVRTKWPSCVIHWPTFATAAGTNVN